MDLNDRVAIVTGGARGIGRAIAEKIAAYGGSVMVADLDADNSANTASEIRALCPGVGVESTDVDVTDRDSVACMASEAVARFGRIDILVNNAGIIGAPGWEQRRQTGRERLGPDLRGQRERRGERFGHRRGVHEAK